MKELIFKLDELEFIKFVPDHDLNCEETKHCCDHAKIYFIHEQQSLLIGQNPSGDILNQFAKNLGNALDNKLQLHESITQNLGFMINEYYHQIFSPNSESSYWVGLNYEIWSTMGDANTYTTTWLYNDDKGDIILEITPLYTWSFQENEIENPMFTTYDEFIKNYKPILRRVIPHKIAQAWLKKAHQWYGIFYKNEQITRDKDLFKFEYFPTKDNTIPTDKNGGEIDVQGNIRYWNKITQEWDIKTKYGYISVHSKMITHLGIAAKSKLLKFIKIGRN